MKSEPPPPGPERDDDELDRSKLERIVPELVRRIVEAGLEKISEGEENVRRAVGDLRLPREALQAVLSQLDGTKTGLYRVVAKEVRDLLEQTNFADELVRALTAVSFEIRTSVRFIPNADGARATPEVKSKIHVNKKGSSPPTPDVSPAADGEPPAVSENTPTGEKNEKKT